MESTKITSVIRRIILSLLLVNASIGPAQALVEKVEITQKPVVDRNSSTVTLRVKVTGKNNKPVPLEEQDFSLKIDCNSRRYNCQEIGSKEWKDWKNPKEAKPPPAFIIVLLDFSGSMKGTDSGGRKKYAAAIQAIRGFVDALSDRSPDTELAIVPFGGDEYSESSCPYDKLISSAELNRFFYVTDEKHSIHLENLEDRKPCAQTTSLYGSLSEAVRLLGNSRDARFHPEEEENEPPKPQPKLSIILLYDGYHTADSEAQEEEEFQELMRLLERDEEIGKITIHTLGYGRTPEYLQKKYGLSRLATRQDVRKHAGLENEFVDRERLGEIAEKAGGIAEFSANASEVAQKLKEFLDAVLGEYEISYIQPNADRVEVHEVQVVVNSANGVVESEPSDYNFPWVPPSPSAKARKWLLLFAFILLVGGGLVPFCFWAKLRKILITL